MAPWLLVVKPRFLVTSASRPSLILTMGIHKPSSAPTPPVVSAGLQSRGTTEHLGDAGAPHQHRSNGFDESCVIYTFCGASSSGGSLPHLTYPFQHAHCLFLPPLATCQGSLGISTPPSIAHQFPQKKICPSPGVLARMLNPESGEIAFESMNPALSSLIL